MLWLYPKSGIDAVKLREWREKAAKTQQWVADQLGVSQSAIDRWEKGAIPRHADMRRLTELTGQAVTVADFYGEDGPPRRKRRDARIDQQAARKAASVRRTQREART